MPHGPGPPQRPHMPGAEGDGLDSAATAKTLRFRDVFPDPHSGHFTAAVEAMDLTSASNWFLQDLQVYS